MMLHAMVNNNKTVGVTHFVLPNCATAEWALGGVLHALQQALRTDLDFVAAAKFSKLTVAINSATNGAFTCVQSKQKGMEMLVS